MPNEPNSRHAGYPIIPLFYHSPLQSDANCAKQTQLPRMRWARAQKPALELGGAKDAQTNPIGGVYTGANAGQALLRRSHARDQVRTLRIPRNAWRRHYELALSGMPDRAKRSQFRRSLKLEGCGAGPSACPSGGGHGGCPHATSTSAQGRSYKQSQFRSGGPPRGIGSPSPPDGLTALAGQGINC